MDTIIIPVLILILGILLIYRGVVDASHNVNEYRAIGVMLVGCLVTGIGLFYLILSLW